MKRTLPVLLLLVAATATADERHLGTPPLPPMARALLKRKMANHSKQMTELVWAVVLLDYRESAKLAQAIATEPRFAKPTTDDATELNAALPPRFFELQDQLRSRAQRLEAAARVRDASAVARSYGALAETCVSCHDAYLAGP